MRNNRGIRTAQRKGELWDLDAVGPRGTGTCMLISPFSCSPTDHQVLLGHWLPKSSAAGKGWCCATTNSPPARGGVPGPPAVAGFPAGDVLGDALAEGWLQTSLPSPPWEAQTLEANAGGTCPARQQKLSLRIAALQIPKAKCTKTLPHSVLKSSGLAPASFLRAYSLASSAFISPPPSKTLKTSRFFMVCMWVKTGQSTGKQYRPKTKAQAQKEVKKHQASAPKCLKRGRWRGREFFPRSPFSRKSSLSLMAGLEVKGLQPFTEANENTDWSKLPFFTDNLFVQRH